MRPVTIGLFGCDYCKRGVDFSAMVNEGMISEADLRLFEFVDNPEEGWAGLLQRGLLRAAPTALKLSLPQEAGRKRPAAQKPPRGG